jgi:Vault protein inter-alpha-trypsin domain
MPLRRSLLLALAACSEIAVPSPGPTPNPPAEPRGAPPQARKMTPRSFRFAPERLPRREAPVESPLGLTASDGTGLALVALDARAVVRDPIAFTELRMTFENPENRVIEGQFKITLPPGAKLSRFAMAIDGRWQEGEVVEKQAARRAYEDFLHRKQDPALLEQAAGNEFTARVFPIPAKGQKQLILSYSQELGSSTEPYRLPLRGLPQIGKLDVEVKHDGAAFQLHETKFVPDQDVEVVVADGRRQGRRDGELVVVRVPLHVGEGAVDEVDSIAILVDTSASRALGWSEEVALVDGLVEGLRGGAGADVPLLVAAFDQDTAPIYEGTVGGWNSEARGRLVARRPLGASNLHGALTFLSRQPRGYGRVLVVSDGVATAGPEDGAVVAGAARELAGKGVRRIDAIAVGGMRDETALQRIVTAGLPRGGTVIDGRSPLPAIADRLTRPTLGDVEITVDGASWSWPKVASGRQQGDEVVVFARVAQAGTLTARVQGTTVVLDGLGAAPQPLLARALAGAEIQSLVDARELVPPSKKAERKELADRIVALSTKHRVLSPLTALLVLETESDYARFGIARHALADIMTVEQGEISVLHRAKPVTPPNGKRQQATETLAQDKDSGPRKEVDEPSPDQAKGESSDGDEEWSGAPEAKKVATGRADRAEEREADDSPRAATSAGPAPEPAAPPPPPPPATEAPRDSRPAPAPRRYESVGGSGEASAPEARVNPYTGKLAQVMRHLGKKELAQALELAWGWRAESPGDVMALIALGEALEKSGDLVTAARAYGSLIDLFPGRADLRRFAGERLDRIASADALALAADSYAKAAAQRPDHPASHRLLAFALVKLERYELAFAALEVGLKQDYPSGRFLGVDRILGEDLGLVAAAWAKAEPARKKEIYARLSRAGGAREDAPSIRFVLNWETDANDVDFHIHDRHGNHAFYSQQELASGGELYEDVTTGYGPECFTIRGKAVAGPYRLEAHYYSRGPMGYGMGKLQVIRHDGRGTLKFEERPFVVMQDRAFVQLGTVR